MLTITGKTTSVSVHPNIKAGNSCSKHYSSFKLVRFLSLPARSPKIKSHSAPDHALRGKSNSAGSFLCSHKRCHFLCGRDGDALKSTRTRVISCKASKKIPTLFVYPPMTSKPKWWWRSFACTPYLLPLHLMWFHADSAYRLHPLLENWEFLVNPFLDTISLMPNWIMMSLMFAAYYLVVRRKEWPHFLRFHVIMAMLLENGYQALAIACGWLPKTLYRGKLGATFWLAVALAQLFTVAECMRAALGGKYADVPLASDAAYIHSDLDLF